MKFTGGYWLLREGVKAFYPQQAYGVETTTDTLTVYAPTKHVIQRGDVLNQALLTVEFSSPVIRQCYIRFVTLSEAKGLAWQAEILRFAHARRKATRSAYR